MDLPNWPYLRDGAPYLSYHIELDISIFEASKDGFY